MQDIRTITNRAEIVEALADLLQQFDRDLNSYQTDVYLYIDSTGAATLDTFVNVGGNSWLNDDHQTIYTDRERYDTFFDWYTEPGELSDCLGIDYNELEAETINYLLECGCIDEDEQAEHEASYDELLEYIKSRADYVETLEQFYLDWIDENRAEYVNTAEEIVRMNEQDADDEEEYRKHF